MTAISPCAPRVIARPVMTQRWRKLTFLHWRYDPEIIARLLPEPFTCDTFDGSAWVALAPFELAEVRWNLAGSAGLALPWISTFPETNVRTYVRGPDGETGVWFFNLEADRLLGVLAARSTYHLPYRWATMSVQQVGNIVEYRSRRLPPFGHGETDVAIEPGPVGPLGDFDHFLTARYRLYTFARGRVGYADIEHHPWPLQSARVIRLRQNLIEASGVPKEQGSPVVHYSEDLRVKVDKLKWI